MRALRFGWVLAVLGLAASACRGDRCASEPASFQLDLTVADETIARQSSSMFLVIRADDHRWVRSIPLRALLADQATSLALVLDPPPAAPFLLQIDAQLFDAAGTPLAVGHLETQATADGCNQFALPFAAGVLDGGVDAGVDASTDGGPDATSGDAELDGGVDGGSDAEPDAETDGGTMDATLDAGDIGPSAFPYVPSNFDPNQLSPLAPLVIASSTCTVTFDSSPPTPRFLPACVVANLPAPEVAFTGGVEHVVLPVNGLDVRFGARLRLIGSRPVVIAVFGDAIIGGTVSATAEGTTPGAGGSGGPQCALGSADNQLPAATDGAGGGGGGFGGEGAQGGDDSAAGGHGLGGLAEAPSTLVPMRGGCPGGNGGQGAGRGAGGGAVQISASGTLTTTPSGLISAGGGAGTRGGEQEGGAGGGSGGGVRLEASQLALGGAVYANGGGGGGGGGTGDHGDTGQNGDRPNPSGGGGGPASGGDGGRGSGTMTPAAGEAAAAFSGAGGGGGGGGPGVIILRSISPCTGSGARLPAPSPPSSC